MTKTGAVHQFKYPFPKIVSPYADVLDKHVDEWLGQYSCLPDTLKHKLSNGRFGNLAAHFFPLATYEMLIPMARWNLCFFSFDDFYGPCNLVELTGLCDHAITVLEGGNLNSNDNEIFKQMAVIREELLSFSNDDWMLRFVRSMKLFFEGMKVDTQYSYKEIVTYPTIDDYIELREKIVATYPLLDMVEIENDYIFPDHIVNNPIIARIRQLACRLVSWSNDVLSLDKELIDHEAMNLVLVIIDEKGYSLDAAVKEAIALHDHDLNELVRISTMLPDFGDLNNKVATYVNNIGLLLQGHISWYKYTRRY